MIVEFMGGKCLRCNYDEHQAALVAHHVNPSKKSFQISTGRTLKWTSFQEECKKCILLCQNCHAVVHATNEEFFFNEDNIPDYKDIIDPRARPTEKKTFKCIDCNKDISPKSLRCKPCAGRSNAARSCNKKIKWPPLDELINLVELNNYSSVGRMLGVSDNAVRKHIKTQLRHSAN